MSSRGDFRILVSPAAGAAGASAGPVLLVFGDRRPRAGMLDALCSAAHESGARLEAVRIATAATLARRLAGRSAPRADILWTLEFARRRRIPCAGRVVWEPTIAAGMVAAVRRAHPGLVCVVPPPGGGASLRRALAVVGRLVDDRLVLDL